MKDISHLYGDPPGSLFEDFYHEELEAIASNKDNKRTLLLLSELMESRAISYYFQHRQGKTAFAMAWLPYIESAIAKYQQFQEKLANQRLAILDKQTGKYWASFGFGKRSCWSNARWCFIFLESERQWLEKLCDRSNKSVGQHRFEVREIDASSRLKT